MVYRTPEEIAEKYKKYRMGWWIVVGIAVLLGSLIPYALSQLTGYSEDTITSILIYVLGSLFVVGGLLLSMSTKLSTDLKKEVLKSSLQFALAILLIVLLTYLNIPVHIEDAFK